MDAERFLREAIELARGSVRDGGGPFGAVVVRGGEVVGRGTNRVVPEHDPSAHAEIAALREAGRRLGTHDLSGCLVFASCEPCPMCEAALAWARVEGLVYAASREDAARAGFDDARFHEELRRAPEERSLSRRRALEAEGRAPFADWAALDGRQAY